MATRVTAPMAVRDVHKPASVTKIHNDTQRFAHTQRELSQAQRARVVAVYLINYEFSEYFLHCAGCLSRRSQLCKKCTVCLLCGKAGIANFNNNKKRNYTGIYLFFFSDTNRLLGFR